MHRALRRLGLPLVAGALLAGCTGPDYVTEHPVENKVPPLQAGVYTVATVDTPPKAIKEVEPDYPEEMGAILMGKATVVFTVRPDGKVADASVLQADDGAYGSAAIAAVSKWRFEPALLKGVPVNCRLTLPFIFDSPWGYGSIGVGGSIPGSGPPDDSSKKDTIQAK